MPCPDPESVGTVRSQLYDQCIVQIVRSGNTLNIKEDNLSGCGWQAEEFSSDTAPDRSGFALDQGLDVLLSCLVVCRAVIEQLERFLVPGDALHPIMAISDPEITQRILVHS